MFSILGGLFSLLLGCLIGLPRRIVDEFERSMDGCVEFFRGWLGESLDSSQQTIASTRLPVGSPGNWLTLLQSILRPNRLARVRVPARRSIR